MRATARSNYERLEFLGDRVLGLAIADWLYELFPDEPEGKLSRRLNVLVSRDDLRRGRRARSALAAQMRLGKQARDDGAFDSDNVLGDVVEALIGALCLDAGLRGGAQRSSARAWGDAGRAPATSAPKHPKSALQEWAAANNRKPPVYELVGRSGPHHAPTFVVEVVDQGRRRGARPRA